MAIAPGLSFLLLHHLKPPTCLQQDILRFQKIRLSPIAKQDYFHVLILEFFKYLFTLPSGSECAVQVVDSVLLLFHIFLLSHCYLYGSSAVQISSILCKVLNNRNCCQLSSEIWSRAQLAAALQLSKCAPVMGTVMPVMVRASS